jgi:hypothetical protein
VVAATAGYSWTSAAITLGTALTAYFLPVHPLWAFAFAFAFAVAAPLGRTGLM